jgi:hypothetical protein
VRCFFKETFTVVSIGDSDSKHTRYRCPVSWTRFRKHGVGRSILKTPGQGDKKLEVLIPGQMEVKLGDPKYNLSKLGEGARS